MDLEKIQNLAAALSEEFSSGTDPYRALASVAEELGEVSAEVTIQLGAGAKAYQGKKSSAAKLREEIGDLLLSVCYLANTLGIDLSNEMEEKYRRLRDRFDLVVE